MQIDVRPSEPGDLDGICRVHDRSRPDELRGSFDARAFVPLRQADDFGYLQTCRLFVATCEGQVVGFAGVDGAYFAWLYVDPDSYRMGVGSRLMKRCLAELGPAAWTIACGNNHPAIALYEGFGFEIEKRYTGKNEGYEGPAVRMALDPALRGWEKPKP